MNEPKKGYPTRLSIDIDPKLKMEAKVTATRQGKSLKDWLNGLIQQEVAKAAKAAN